MDANECLISFMKGITAEILWSKTSYVPRKQDAGGQSAVRFQRNREIALNEWFKECNEQLNLVFKDIDMKGVKFLLGINKCNETDFFARMHSYTKDRLITSETVSYISINGCYELIEKCHKHIKDYKVARDKELVDDFALLLAKNSPLVDYGINALNDKNQIVIYSDKVTTEELRLIEKIKCLKHRVKDFHIIDALRICVINLY